MSPCFASCLVQTHHTCPQPIGLIGLRLPQLIVVVPEKRASGDYYCKTIAMETGDLITILNQMMTSLCSSWFVCSSSSLQSSLLEVAIGAMRKRACGEWFWSVVVTIWSTVTTLLFNATNTAVSPVDFWWPITWRSCCQCCRLMQAVWVSDQIVTERVKKIFCLCGCSVALQPHHEMSCLICRRCRWVWHRASGGV